MKTRLLGLFGLLRLALRTRSPVAFVVRQGRRSPGPTPYRLRGSGVVVCVRHGTDDLHTFDEVFVERQYDPPPAVEASLGRIGHPLRVADLGGNIGLFGAYAFGRFDVGELTAYEPDPANATVHRAAVDKNTLRWVLAEVAAGPRDGAVELIHGGFALSRVTSEASEATTRVPMVDVFEELRDVDVIKIDIEGGEWPILEDQRMARLTATCIVAEYHPDSEYDGIPRLRATTALQRAGFHVVPFIDRPDGTGMLWAWRDPVVDPSV
ncbi:MAG: FkbM family methyltransferase [Solirubrobacterales bacterium]